MRYVCTESAKATKRLPISAKVVLEERVERSVADVELLSRSNNLLGTPAKKNANRMKSLDRKFAIAPMMEWSESAISSDG
jgi:hypothetical protein